MIDRMRGLMALRKTKPDFPGDRRAVYFPRKRGNIVVTYERAFELSACFSCCRTISEDIAKLPWPVYKREGDRKVRQDGSSLHTLLNTRPNPNMTAFTFRETLMMWVLSWGNGYAEIERDMSGRAMALWPIPPDRVEPRRDYDGSIYYEVNNMRDGTAIIPQRDMFHIHGVGWDGLMGYSMIGLAAQTLGFALASEEHGSNFYGNNTTIGLALKTDQALDDEGFQRLKGEMEDKQGSANAWQGIILEHGLDFAYPNMSQVDAQYVETRRQTVEEICRWWRIPPHKVAELSRAHFANVENLNIDYATDALMPWCARLEQEADWKLMGLRTNNVFTRLSLNELMRGDSKARAEWYKEMWSVGAMNADEIREEEGMDPLPNGNGKHYFIQSGYVTVENAAMEPQEPKEEDIATRAVESLADRLLSGELKKAVTARKRYDRTEFAEWIDIQQAKAKNRHELAFVDILPTLESVYDFSLSAEELADIYREAERKELFALYDGEKPDYSRVTQALLEVL